MKLEETRAAKKEKKMRYSRIGLAAATAFLPLITLSTIAHAKEDGGTNNNCTISNYNSGNYNNFACGNITSGDTTTGSGQVGLGAISNQPPTYTVINNTGRVLRVSCMYCAAPPGMTVPSELGTDSSSNSFQVMATQAGSTAYLTDVATGIYLGQAFFVTRIGNGITTPACSRSPYISCDGSFTFSNTAQTVINLTAPPPSNS
ncbi:hypothetical protein ABT187_49735 [Streptomyces sp. NPDC001817]|uniref:hypothetical protein n=1 Tax=Streptomyces sp. NPDC001817 TaxID=3154398 RepID=UPI003333E8E9